jgi:hypothetical protein
LDADKSAERPPANIVAADVRRLRLNFDKSKPTHVGCTFRQGHGEIAFRQTNRAGLALRRRIWNCQQAGGTLLLEQAEPPDYGSTVMQPTKAKPTASPTKKAATRLSPKQLRRLADRMVASKDSAEAARLKKELERGFYGDPAHA